MKKGQVGQFTKMHRLVEGGTTTGNRRASKENSGVVQSMGVKKELVRAVLPLYRTCVKALGKVMDAEEDGDLCPMDPLNESDWKHTLNYKYDSTMK